MTKHFKIADDLTLPPEAVTQTFALLARRGAGKTHTASVLAEEILAAGFPIVVLDPTGVWWGLRSGYPIAILGGKHGDVPLEPTGGKVVAQFVVRERVPVILDVSAFGENEMRRFVADFASEFYRINTDAIHWFVDEADEFAPQSAAGGPQAKSLGAMQNIVRRGRAKGIGCTLITQRSAVLNKSVLTQTECLIALQTTGPHDLRAIDDWIKYHGTQAERDAIMHSLPRLQQGDAWVYSPAWLKLLKRVRIRRRRTYDSSATPKPGEQKAPPRSLAEVDLGSLTKQLADTIEKAKSDDPAELRKRIAELERKAKSQLSAAVDQAAIDRVVQRAVAERDKHWQGEVAKAEKAHRSLAGKLTKIHELSVLNGDATIAIQQPAAVKPVARVAAPVSRVAKPLQPPVIAGDVRLGKCERAILLAAYWLRNETPTKAKLAFYADYSGKSSGVDKALSNLRTAGLMEGLSITGDGVSTVGAAPDKPTGGELRDWLRPKLGIAENSILDALMSGYPQRLTKDEVAERSGYSDRSSGLDKALSNLRTIEAAEGSAKDGGTKAADVFFE